MVGRDEWRVRGALLLFWALPALMGTVGFLLVPSRLNPTLSGPAILASQLLMWSLWAVHTLGLWWLGDRLLPWRPGRRWRIVLAHGLAAVVIVIAQIFWQQFWSRQFGLVEARGVESTLVIGLRSSGDYSLVIVVAIVVAQLGARWYAGLQSERAAAARLGEDLAQAQLRALQAQLHPHFLFNALNSVVALIGRDAAAAQQLVVQLADLLRVTLKTGGAQVIPLAQELDVTRQYLAIAQVRFADRLTVVWPSPPCPDALVPTFALQPLVENALHHGVGRLTGAGVVEVALRTEPAVAGEMLVVTVRDNGPGPGTAASPAGAGTGLANLRARLARLYGRGASLTLQDDPAGGAVATLRVPMGMPMALPLRPAGGGAGGSGTPTSQVGASGT